MGRGAITVAAVQTLPEHTTPMRSVLVLVAYTVAALSLAVQGGTIGPLVRWLSPAVDSAAAAERTAEERDRIMALLRTSAESVPAQPAPSGTPGPDDYAQARRRRLAVIDAQRAALLDERDTGTFDADVLEGVLANLDAAQIAIELRGTADDAEE